ncbi:MAG: bifunctional (p)ppGpp synthetase/guanosine-3',5'-bis(diphosphate) 3'-pyrophosphohydrolase [Armatimonadetes bacterium]|nr:bifunctional (p)ppGpp synthetase/guanosine-3',5'-bis(diphosphate) 3'-pyrophosphohydrolase [Armatimonadota bacterium]
MSEFAQLTKALDFCVDAHRGQYRDGEAAVPYACHPVEVMLTMRHRAGVTDEEVLCAALLHDTVEDTQATLEDLQREFGPVVAGLVAEVTRIEPEREPGMGKEEFWTLRTGLLLEEIGRMSRMARLIKLCDRLSNIVESERTRTGPKRDRYRRQTVWILQTIPRETHVGLWDAVASAVGFDGAEIAAYPKFPG